MVDLPAVSIVVPTFREADNLPTLVRRTFQTLVSAGLDGEMVVVDDDSHDGVEAVVDRLTHEYPVRLIVRHGVRGLATAVLRGFTEARFDQLVVLDADLQHPPEVIPKMVELLNTEGCDFVIGTRYGGDGGVDDAWPWHRRIISRLATALARPLADLSDPMSGFFAIRRSTWREARPLDPIGYKVALELYVKCGCRRPREVPIRFSTRSKGRSKLNFGEHVKFARHLVRLYRFRFPMRTYGLMVAATGMLLMIILWVVG